MLLKTVNLSFLLIVTIKVYGRKKYISYFFKLVVDKHQQ